jgi:hypothetical protein
LDRVKAKVEESGDYRCDVAPVNIGELFPQRSSTVEGGDGDDSQSCCLLFDQVIDLRHFSPLEDFSFVTITKLRTK